MDNPVTEEELDRTSRASGWPTAAPEHPAGSCPGVSSICQPELGTQQQHGGVPGTHGPPSLPNHQDHSTSHEGGFRQKISPNVIFSLPASV